MGGKPAIERPDPSETPTPEATGPLASLFALLKTKSDIDFSVYQLPMEPDRIFLNTARSDLTIVDDGFESAPADATSAFTLPTDVFLDSLTQNKRAKATGVAHSGAGSDGMLGCQAIEQQSGAVFVQEPASAKYDSTPASVLARNLSDGAAIPEKLPGFIFNSIPERSSPALVAGPPLSDEDCSQEQTRPPILPLLSAAASQRRPGRRRSFV